MLDNRVPIILLFTDIVTRSTHDDLIVSLGLTICLRTVGSRRLQVCSQLDAYCLKEICCKLGPLAVNNSLEIPYEMTHCSTKFLHRPSQSFFVRIALFNFERQSVITAINLLPLLCIQKVPKHIHHYILQGSLHWEQLNRASMRRELAISLTRLPSLDIIVGVIRYVWPIIRHSHCDVQSSIARVTGYR